MKAERWLSGGRRPAGLFPIQKIFVPLQAQLLNALIVRKSTHKIAVTEIGTCDRYVIAILHRENHHLMMPSRSASATACARLVAPSLRTADWVCAATVRFAMCKISPISQADFPLAIQRRTSISRGESLAFVVVRTRKENVSGKGLSI